MFHFIQPLVPKKETEKPYLGAGLDSVEGNTKLATRDGTREKRYPREDFSYFFFGGDSLLDCMFVSVVLLVTL